MADPTVRGVILDVDSPGGEVGGLFDLVEQIGAIKAASDKPLWAVANEGALSAAYAIASAADRLYVTRTGEVGSVGVVAVHVDESGADAKAGLAWTFVFAGEQKVDGNAHEPLSERARATIQADVDRLYAEFCGLVAANRGMSSEAVRGTKAAIYRGELAIRAGLADRVGTLDLAIAEMAAELDRCDSCRSAPTINPTPKRSPSMATNETERDSRRAAEPQQPQAPSRRPQPSSRLPHQRPQPAPSQRLRPSRPPSPIRPTRCARSLPRSQRSPPRPPGSASRSMRRTRCARASRPKRCAAPCSIRWPRAPRRPASSRRRHPPLPAGDSPIVRRAKERAAAART